MSLLRRLRGVLNRDLIEVLGVALSLIGAILLGLSFQATASDMQVVTGYAWEAHGTQGSYEPYVALCTGNNLVIRAFKGPNSNMDVSGACPKGDIERPVAAVTRESRRFFFWGWMAVIVSFLLQVGLVIKRPLYMTVPRN